MARVHRFVAVSKMSSRSVYPPTPHPPAKNTLPAEAADLIGDVSLATLSAGRPWEGHFAHRVNDEAQSAYHVDTFRFLEQLNFSNLVARSSVKLA